MWKHSMMPYKMVIILTYNILQYLTWHVTWHNAKRNSWSGARGVPALLSRVQWYCPWRFGSWNSQAHLAVFYDFVQNSGFFNTHTQMPNVLRDISVRIKENCWFKTTFQVSDLLLQTTPKMLLFCFSPRCEDPPALEEEPSRNGSGHSKATWAVWL